MTKEDIFICSELDNMLRERVGFFVKAYIVKNRKKLILDYIEKHLKLFMEEDRVLTSDEVMNMLQISRQTLGRRIKNGILKPVNPDAKRHYRFNKSEVCRYLENGGK